eukprot:m.323256 g.323256  ORF g.323256 m.323256 type:complete len:464 (-) comp19724_c1_seq5:1746-3137(-)
MAEDMPTPRGLIRALAAAPTTQKKKRDRRKSSVQSPTKSTTTETADTGRKGKDTRRLQSRPPSARAVLERESPRTLLRKLARRDSVGDRSLLANSSLASNRSLLVNRSAIQTSLNDSSLPTPRTLLRQVISLSTPHPATPSATGGMLGATPMESRRSTLASSASLSRSVRLSQARARGTSRFLDPSQLPTPMAAAASTPGSASRSTPRSAPQSTPQSVGPAPTTSSGSPQPAMHQLGWASAASASGLVTVSSRRDSLSAPPSASQSRLDDSVASAVYSPKRREGLATPDEADEEAVVAAAAATSRLRGKRRRVTEPGDDLLTAPAAKHLFATMTKVEVSSSTTEPILDALKLFADNLVNDLSAFAKHAGRRTVEVADVELLLKRQRLVRTDDSGSTTAGLHALLREHLPTEVVEQIIPMAVAHNHVRPPPRPRRRSRGRKRAPVSYASDSEAEDDNTSGSEGD